MVTRNYGLQELPPYSRLLQIGNGDNGAGGHSGDDGEEHREILTLEELKPHHLSSQNIQQHETAVYYDLSSIPE